MPKDSKALEIVAAWAAKRPQLGPTVEQHRFHPTRRWRFDLAWPDLMIAFECEGGIWINGRHNRGTGFTADCEKYSEAAARGWCVIRGTPAQIRAGDVGGWIAEAVQRRLRGVDSDTLVVNVVS